MSTADTPDAGDDFVPGPGDDASERERELWDAVDDVPDPHMPVVSVAELGMIYDLRLDGDAVTVDMTFPCMGCPAYDMIHEDVEDRLLEVDGVESVTIEIVWEPVWSKDMLEPHVREQLGEWGVAL
ncbi:MAG: metal-sulfur cluster assembly factor [Halobacteriales archaeon]